MPVPFPRISILPRYIVEYNAEDIVEYNKLENKPSSGKSFNVKTAGVVPVDLIVNVFTIR